jgi:replicative DNA helicase
MSTIPDTVAPLPHAPGVEKSVLSVISQWPEKMDEAPDLTPEHFHTPAHRTIFDMMRERLAAGLPIELVSFTQALLDRSLLDRVGGPSALSDIHTHQPSPGHFRHHIEILTRMKARRMAITTGAEIMRVAYESDQTDDILDATSAPISAIHDTITGTRPSQTTKAVIGSCIERFRELCEGKVTPMGIETSLFEINRRFRGLHPRQTIVISGYPGGGKTTLAAQLAADAALDGHNTLIVSLEMPAQTMMERLLAYVARRPGEAITDPLRYCRERFDASCPTKDLIDSIGGASRKLAESPLAIEDLTGANVHQIAACIRRSHRKRPLEVVVVDFIQRVRPVPDMRRESREQQLAHASNHLADLAKELGFCLLLPSQLNKEGAAKHCETVNEDSDLHLQIIQERSGPSPSFDHIGLGVMKDRHAGQDGNVLPIVLDGPMLRFVPKPFTP